jgi:type II secretory pathway component PulM
MALQQRLDALQPRERRLLLILGGAFAFVFVLLVPIGVSAMLAERKARHEELQSVMGRLFAERDQILMLQAKNKQVLDRYKVSAPPLAGFLDNSAKALEIEIPEFKDRSPAPIGKTYEERSTDISLKKIGMRKLILFMEKIAQAHFPVSISKFTVRKRATEGDSWDVNMTVSAYHRVGGKTGTGAADKSNDAKEEEP